MANALLMPKVKGIQSAHPNIIGTVAVLIPARNEEENLPRLLQSLQSAYAGIKIYVFDDESTDGTAEVARRAGAVVLCPTEPLPTGWTGKNRACDALAKAAIEDFSGECILFLDADTEVRPGLLEGIVESMMDAKLPIGVVTGMPWLIHGTFPEPLFLAWVPWILLSSNPFWLVARTGMGHNFFTNGQIVLWKKSVYQEIWPHSTLRGAVLEDARIGRLLAKKKIRILVLDLSDKFQTYMYKNWRECFDGLSKNSYEIMGNHLLTWCLALFLLATGWGWAASRSLFWIPLTLLCISGGFSAKGTKSPWYLAILAPVTISIGAITVFRSSWWKYRNKVIWKGRNYA